MRALDPSIHQALAGDWNKIDEIESYVPSFVKICAGMRRGMEGIFCARIRD